MIEIEIPTSGSNPIDFTIDKLIDEIKAKVEENKNSVKTNPQPTQVEQNINDL